MTSIGFLRPDGGNKFTDSFISDVTNLMRSGNSTGNPAFHFSGDAQVANLVQNSLSDTGAMSPWYGVLIQILNKAIARALDVGGATPLAIPAAPVFDTSSAPALGLPAPLPLPPPGGEVPWALALAGLLQTIGVDPTSTLGLLVARLNASGVITPKPAVLPTPPTYSLGGIKGLEFFNDPSVKVEGMKLPALISRLVQLPFDLLRSLYVPNLALVQMPTMATLPTVTMESATALALAIPEIATMTSLSTVPINLKAIIYVWLKNVSAMVSTLLVGMTVGAGELAKTMATMAGMI